MSEEDREALPPGFAQQLRDGQPVDAGTLRDVARFRRAERKRFLDLRRALSVEEAQRQTERIALALDDLLDDVSGRIVSVYWPIRGEPDLRAWMARLCGRGARVALPVVVAREAPLVFRAWEPGVAMERGIWNIPVPAGTEALVPEVVIAPVVALDEAGFRLGNGGGYYDRTLATFDPLPARIGVGHEAARMKTIFPMPWDVPMQAGIFGDGSLAGSADLSFPR